MDNTEIIKNRSLGACFRDAYDLFANNLLTILRRTWLPALVLALVSALIVFATITPFDPMSMTPEQSLTQVRQQAALALILIATAFVTIWIDTRVISLLTGRPAKDTLPRVVKATLFIVLLIVVMVIIVAGAGILPLALTGKGKAGITPDTLAYSTIISAALTLVFIISFIPILYSSMKYLIEPEQKVKSILGRPYLRGWRAWGYLFMIVLLMGILSGIIALLTQAPALIIQTAQTANATSMVMGDANGITTATLILFYVVTTLCNFIWSYVFVWCTFVNYFAYGSIEARQQAKAALKLANTNK